MGNLKKRLRRPYRAVKRLVGNGAASKNKGSSTVPSAVTPSVQPASERVEKLVLEPLADAQINGPKAIYDLDRTNLLGRYHLPKLSRMAREDQSLLVEPLLSLKRLKKLGLNADSFAYPEARWKMIYNLVDANTPGVGEVEAKVVFSGLKTSELNAFMSQQDSRCISVESPTLLIDETLLVPSNTRLYGNYTQLLRDSADVEKAILLDGVKDVLVYGFCIDSCCRYPIYVKNCSRFALIGNTITNNSFKSITIMGENELFSIKLNRLVNSGNGGIFLNGSISKGVIENNTIEGTRGGGNFSGGIVLSSIEIADINTAFNPWRPWEMTDLTDSPHELVILNNQIVRGEANGMYSHAGYCNYFVGNNVEENNKEGMCLDFGSCGCYVAYNTFKRNGGRFNMTQHDLEDDFIQDFGVLPDGSSPAKIPGISLDNAAYNIIYHNIISENYGSGFKIVRSGLRNVVLCNEITDNNLGQNDRFHFFGVEFGSDYKPDYEAEGVHELDFTPCFENIIARNTISGNHYSGIFMGKDAYINDAFDNVIIGSVHPVEVISNRLNALVNNHVITV